MVLQHSASGSLTVYHISVNISEAQYIDISDIKSELLPLYVVLIM